MSFMGGLGRGLLSFVAFMLLSLWFSVAALQMTLLNRDVVAGWMRSSGIYQNLLAAVPTQVGEGEGQPMQLLITPDNLKTALGEALPPSALQQQFETALNATYDWLEGKTPAITFSISLADKKEAFSAALAKQIEPKLAAMPPCASRLAPDMDGQPTCLPQGMSAADYAAQLTRLGDGSNSLFDRPITPTDILPKDAEVPDMGWLPAVVANLRWAGIALPIGALLFAIAYVFLSESKLRGLAIIGRRALFHGGILAAFGLVLWYFGSSSNLSSIVQTDDPVQRAALKNIADPLLRVVTPHIGQVLTLLGAIPAALGGGAWLSSVLIRKQIEAKDPMHMERTLPKPYTPPPPGDAGKPKPPTIVS